MADVDIMGMGSQVMGLGMMGVGLGLTVGMARMVQDTYQPYKPRRAPTKVNRPAPYQYSGTTYRPPYRPLAPRTSGWKPTYAWRI